MEVGNLIIGRKPGEGVVIGDDVRVSIVQIRGGSVRLSIRAPKDVHIAREELLTPDTDSICKDDDVPDSQ